MTYYDIIADKYDDILAEDGVASRNREKFRALVMSYVPKDHLLVDFGGGTGLDAEFYASQGYRVVLYEPSTGMRREAKKSIFNNGLSSRIEVSEDTFSDFINVLAKRTGKVSIVSNFGPLNHLSYPDRQIEQLAAVVSPGGYFIHYILRPFYIEFLKKRSFQRNMLTVFKRGSVAVQDGTHKLNLFFVQYLKDLLAKKFVLLKTVKSHPQVGGETKHRLLPLLFASLLRRSVFVVFEKMGEYSED